MRRTAIGALTLAVALPLVACSGGGATGTTAVPPSGGEGGIASEGERIFSQICSACHGANAEGVEGLGPALADNEFVQSNSDEEMVAFLVVGRPADDPANQSGIAMPARGGNPSLTDADLLDVVAYLRTLQP